MTTSPAPGQIVILNGPPRSGKSSIAAAIQASFEGVWMNLGVDRFMAMTPARYHPGIGLRPGGERPDLEPLVRTLYAAMYESIAAHSRLGLSVVTDIDHHDCYSTPLGILPDCARRLAGLPALFVGVRCAVEVIVARRRATGWHTAAEEAEALRRAQMWEDAVHTPGIYDLEVDTSVLSAEECAARIAERLASGEAGTALAELAALG